MVAAVPWRVNPGLDAVSARKMPFLGCLRMIVLTAVAACGLWSAPLPAPAELAPAVALSFRAEHLKAAFRSGDPAAIQTAVQEVELLRRTYGTLDVLPLVDAMAVFARQLGDQGHPDQGLEVVQTMDQWAPNASTLLGTRVILMRQQGLHGYLWSLPEVLELTRLRLAQPAHRWLWAVQHLAWVRLMATVLLWGWALALAMRYRRVFRYLWEEPLRRWGLNPQVTALAGAFLVTFPVVLGLDPSVAAMLWLWLLVPFLAPTEIRASFIIVLLQLAHPALALMEPLAAGQPSPSIVAMQLQPQAVPVDRAWAALPAGDRSFLAGWRQLQLQEWDRAERTFKALESGHPDHAAVLNNLGVARFQQGDLGGAKASFDAAAALAPGAPEILLNQSVVAFKQMDSALGAAKQEEASRAAPESYNRMVVANHARKEQRTFAMPLPDSPGRLRALASGARQDSPRAGLGRQDAPILFHLVLPLLAALAILLRLHRSINQVHPSQCTRCGDPFHTTDSPDASVCSKCHHLFTLKDGLHSGSRKRKVDEVASYQKSQRVLHRLLVVLLPGTDRCFIGNTRAGCVEYGFFCFALGLVLVTGRAVRYPGEVLADPASTWLPVGLALLAILLFRSWLKLLPRRS